MNSIGIDGVKADSFYRNPKLTNVRYMTQLKFQVHVQILYSCLSFLSCKDIAIELEFLVGEF